ncbi:paeninodin family lasso peptide [Paenibacillus sp. RRE4]|nr:paeninodin family lasso peptide [Paenibacillus sp. RRE4]MDT0123098.1 paeninodin family lasso peptide [Paenibacillus sp. RRE4]
METKKTPWLAPKLEVLDVRQQTMAGRGYKQIDWISEHDADLYNPASSS